MASQRRRKLFALAAFVLLALAIPLSLRSAPVRIFVCRHYLWLEDTWLQHWRPPVGHNFISSVKPLLARLGTLDPVRVELEPGVSFLLDPRDLVERTILIAGEWEPQVWQAISSGLAPGAVFLDVGAHIGYYSIKSGVRVGPGGRVVAFEPNPATLELLRGNIAASAARNIIVEPIACTGREQTLTLFGGPPGNIGTSSLSRGNVEMQTSAPSSYTVRGRPIDAVAAELGLNRLDVMKVDVEGAEYLVLLGARETLRRFHPKLVMEVKPDLLAGMHAKVEDILALLQEAGYTHKRRLDDWDWEWTAR